MDNYNIESSNEDYLNNPISVIDKLFQIDKNNLNNGLVVTKFENVLSSNEIYNSVPIVSTINQCDLNTGKLVKIRCMIQDIFDPQFCPTYNKIKNTKTGQVRLEPAKYRTSTNIKQDEEFDIDFFSDPFDKLVLYCIPIPCENKWVTDNIQNNNNTTTTTTTTSSSNGSGNSVSSGNKKKRNIDDIEMGNDSNSNSNSNSKTDEIKKTKDESTTTSSSTNTTSSSSTPSASTTSKIDINKIFNYPIPIDSNNSSENIKTPFIVNVYDDNIILDDKGKPVSFKINEIVEFVGVVSTFNGSGSGDTIGNGDEGSTIVDLMSQLDVDEISTIPDSLIPHFNVLTYRYINPYDQEHYSKNPFSKQPTTTPTTTTTNTTDTSKIREEILEYISKFVVDPLLSEYILFHLLSKVYSFTAGLCIGNFSLSISIPNDDEYKKLPELIEMLFSSLVSRSHRFSMTIDNLNDADVIPYKDYDRNRIVSGLLQLSKNTNLIIDETKLLEGKIESQGIKVLNALNTLFQQQKVEYDFKFHPIEINTDIQCCSVSYGKSLIKSFCQISIDPSLKLPSLQDCQKLIGETGSTDKLNIFRKYLNDCKNQSFKLLSDQQDDEQSIATTFIQDDFVKSRQSNPDMTTDTFHYWLTLSRLVALSFGDNYIKIDKWNKMKSLEDKKNKK